MAEDTKNDEINEEEPSIEEILSSIRQIISTDDEEDSDASPSPEDDSDKKSAPLTQKDEKVEEPIEEANTSPENEEKEEQPAPLTEENEQSDETSEEYKADVDIEEDDDILDLENIVLDNDANTKDKDLDQPVSTDETLDNEQDMVTEEKPITSEEDIFGSGDVDIDFDEELAETDSADDIDMPEEQIVAANQDETALSEQLEEIGNEDSFAESVEDAEHLMSQQAVGAVEDSIEKLASTLRIANQPNTTLQDIVSQLLRPMLKDWLDHNLPPMIERIVKEEIEKITKKL